jgi:hypothetical protein
MLERVEKVAEEAESEQLPNIDDRILEWTMTTTLGMASKNFSSESSLPGFLNSDLVKACETDSLKKLGRYLSDALGGFWEHTISSNSASDADNLHLLYISLKAMERIGESSTGVSSILRDMFFKCWDKVPQTLEIGQSLTYWCTVENKVTAYYAQSIITRILACVQKRDDDWVSLAARAFDLPEHDFRSNITGVAIVCYLPS